MLLCWRGTPQGTVQRYLIALENQDYQQAYNLLIAKHAGNDRPYNDWRRQNTNRPAGQTGLEGDPRQDCAKRQLCYSGGYD